MPTFRYKVNPTDTWTTLAGKFGLSTQSLMRANPGASTLSTGMGINVPRLGVTSTVGGLNAAQSNARAMRGPYDNNLTGYYNDAYSKPPTTSFPNILRAERGAASNLPPATNTGRGTGNFNMNYSSSGTIPAAAPTTTGNIYNDPYASIRYERNPVTGQPMFNMVPVYRNGQQVTDRQGNPITTPSSIYVRDIPTAAAHSGVSTTTFTEDLKAQGYTLFGGQWVYVGTGQPRPTGQPARNAHGNLIRRRETETFNGAPRETTTATISSNFGVGTG